MSPLLNWKKNRISNKYTTKKDIKFYTVRAGSDAERFMS